MKRDRRIDGTVYTPVRRLEAQPDDGLADWIPLLDESDLEDDE